MQNISALLSAIGIMPETMKVYHVHDGSSWILYWIAKYITKELNQRNLPALMTTNPWRLRGQIVHFGSRYTYLASTAQKIHPSNHIFLTWHHGNPSEIDFQSLFLRLLSHLSEVDLVIASNRTTQQQLIHAGLPPEKMKVIPIGIDTKLFQPPTELERQLAREQLGINDKEFCIGSFQKDGSGWGDGREPKLIKGPDIFLRVIEKLTRVSKNIVVLLTGPARGYIKAGLDDLKVKYIHHFVADYTEIRKYYHALDSYLITARDEGGPVGFMESWASGVPVVSTSMGMPADYIENEKNGLMANSEDVDELTTYVERLIFDKGLIQQITTQALRDVQQLDWHILVEHYLEIYKPIFEK